MSKGNLNQFYDRLGTDFHLEVAQNYGPVVRMQSLLGEPILYVYDPKALNTIITKDHQSYQEEELFVKANMLIFGPGLISTTGHQHRKQRKMLNPVFSINHMRHMLPIFYSVTNKLHEALSSRLRDGPRELDMLNWMGRTALELIGQGGLGVSFDPLIEDTSDPYADAVKNIIPTLYQLTLLRQFVPYVESLGPVWFRRLVVKLFPHKQLQKMRSIIATITQRSVDIYEDKKKGLTKGDELISSLAGDGKDIISILMSSNLSASEPDRLTEDEIIAQMTTLLFAAMDTTSNSLARILERLAQRLDVQEKLRREIIQAWNDSDGNLSYDSLMRLPYLDAVCRETMRVDPADNLVVRQPIKDVILPLSEPIRGVDGTLMHQILIPKGTKVIIGILGSNINKALWGEDALEWRPERWLAPLPNALTEAPIPGVYSNLMTFSGGGRSCIGFKFSELEMKVVLSALLPSFTFELTGKPIVWNVASVRYPTVGKENNDAQLPLKVGLVSVVHA
ncbi:uncharacterized protein FIBRA_02112 [Fibroporia radiculosa]|uniref:Cytochrome P450 n=1 Tax=Fibroporia radiculosa TaxID=599839 RepID=J4GMF3_9APHY|nr:uncharacterized protein FIBRA_02112 [Fibroporia radiculosa]CCM00085.1 predicted protein [Fibroporia radiculosa]